MFQKNITKEEINRLPLIKFDGDSIIIDSIIKVKQAIIHLASEKIIGFDTETRPSFKKGRVNKVALLQLATKNKAYLFRLNKIGLPAGILKILSDRRIIKVGVAIHDDIRILKKIAPYMPESFIDLQDFVKKFGIEDSGLQKLAAIVLNGKISKAQQLTNWEGEELTHAQITYAATDAWVCLEIFNKLNEYNPEFFIHNE